MKFRAEIPIPKIPVQIEHNDAVFFIGSCFSEHIYHWMKSLKFNCFSNPSGIVYNPISITQILKDIHSEKHYSEADLLSQENRWISLNHHGLFDHHHKEQVLSKINENLQLAQKHLLQSKVVFITLGTSLIYRFKKTNEVVANCHKIPSVLFTKEQLKHDEVRKTLSESIQLIRSINTNAQIVFTVSPVRHLKDGFVENQRSKSVLISALHEAMVDSENCFYFPAYEAVIDDLRDYRFFERDLTHPNELAVDYVKELFSSVFFNEKTERINTLINKINLALNHRFMHEDEEEKVKFKESVLNLINSKELEGFDFSKEKNRLTQILVAG